PRLSRHRRSRRFANLPEYSALVVIEPILPVIRNVQILPPVVVIISHTGSLTPAAGIGKSSLLRHIAKGAVMIVAVKMIRGALTCGKALQRGAVDEKNIRPAKIGRASSR